MLPSPLEILLKDQSILVIEDAAAWSRKVVDHFDASTYRNTFLNNQISLNPVSVSGTGTLVTNTAALQVPGTVTGDLVNEFDSTASPLITSTRQSKIIIDDVAGAVDPHPWLKPRTRWDFWSGAVGFALAALEVTLTSGSATAVVPDNTRLFPGQAITGTNIPINTVILSVPHANRNSIVMSNKATGTGDTTAVLTGSNWLGGFFEDEAVGEGIDALILQ